MKWDCTLCYWIALWTSSRNSRKSCSNRWSSDPCCAFR